jgi:leader peptidase (prepilin peptidase)/N-methyltransferase
LPASANVTPAGLIGSMLAYLSYPALPAGGFEAFLLGGIAGIISARVRHTDAFPSPPCRLTAAILALFFT